MIRRILYAALLSFASLNIAAQQSSTNGWYLSPSGTIRVLVAFVEITYDTLPGKNISPDGSEAWRPGELPVYADSIFDPHITESPRGMMTRYYREASFGNLHVLGDYFPELIQVPYSRQLRENRMAVLRAVAEWINRKIEADSVVSAHGLRIDDFDIWKNSQGTGLPKELRGDTAFDGVDHIMVITRNYDQIPRATGMASGSSMSIINGKRTDTYSLFSGAGVGLPFGILRHEFNHLLLGGNNFHSGGGNSSKFRSYFPFLQGGWGMMGAANSSLLTSSGWDRYRLGWKPVGNRFIISALNGDGSQADTDIHPTTGAGEYILRDYQRTGDVLRIRLPFIPESEYQQWLWIENHTTKKFNGSEFDVFQYQADPCIRDASPGLYMYVQVDAEKRFGNGAFSVNADMRRPVLADGNFDFQWMPEPLQLPMCINDAAYYPYFLEPESENPLTGNHTQEFTQFYTDADSVLSQETVRDPFTHKIGDVYERIAMLGNPRQAFREGYNTEIGIGTNPSSANMLTMVNARRQPRLTSQDNRTIYLNGINVKILETYPDKRIRVKVTFDDNRLNRTRRWCAPLIVLNNHVAAGSDLIISGKLILDIGKTMTRFDQPITIQGETFFTDPTTLEVRPNAEILLDKGEILLRRESILRFDSAAVLKCERGSRITIEGGSVLALAPGALFSGKGRFKIRKGSRLECHDRALYAILRKRTFNKKRVHLINP